MPVVDHGSYPAVIIHIGICHCFRGTLGPGLAIVVLPRAHEFARPKNVGMIHVLAAD